MLDWILAVLGVLTGGILYAYNGNLAKGIKHIVKNEDIGAGIVKFVGLVIAIPCILLLLSGCSTSSQQTINGHRQWFSYTEIYAGLEETNKRSYLCEAGGDHDRIVSNGGIDQNVWISKDETTSVDAVVAHHGSCAFGEDAQGYDSFFGVKAKKRIWW